MIFSYCNIYAILQMLGNLAFKKTKLELLENRMNFISRINFSMWSWALYNLLITFILFCKQI